MAALSHERGRQGETMIWKIAAVTSLAIGAFVFWRYTSVARGARKRDDALNDRLVPLGERLEAKEPISVDEVRALAAQPELREMIYIMLAHYARLDLFPAEYLSLEAHAVGLLAYWMMHPNELQAAPESLELVERFARQTLGEMGTYYVFRYRMPEGHWNGTEWQLGLAGPFFAEDRPYVNRAGAFARAGDVAGKVTPAALVDWYVDLLRRKTAA
jgi:hypothetical protein